MAPAASQRAFTLIEVLVVIIIIAVMVAVVVPSYTGLYARARFDSATKEVQDVFAYARERAVSTDTTVTLAFDQSNETFVVHTDPAPPISDAPVALQTDAGAGTAQEPPHIVSLSDEFRVASFQAGGQAIGPPQVRFRGDGTSDQAEMLLVNRDGRSAHLVLWPATGRMTQEDAP
jgi:prepilin-type N-terminal cleavage/methylation domain-containing protein